MHPRPRMTITAPLTQPLRDEHCQLLPAVEMLRSTADLVGASPVDQVCGLLEELHTFLVERLIPHTVAEDSVLYPAVEEAMGMPGATRALSLDHRAIVRLSDDLGWLRGQLCGKMVTRDQAMALHRVLYGLHAILKLHLATEEAILIPVLDGWLTPERATALFRISAEAEAAAATIAPAQRPGDGRDRARGR